MIGVISEDKSIYGVLEKIHNKYPTTMIYLYYSNDYEKGIEVLKNNNCKVIILPEGIIRNNTSNTIFLSMTSLEKENAYNLDNKELIEAINSGDEEKVMDILEKLNIKEDTIVLNNPKLLFIKSIIEDKFNNKNVVDNVSILINQIDEYESLLEKTKDATIKIIIENNR